MTIRVPWMRFTVSHDPVLLFSLRMIRSVNELTVCKIIANIGYLLGIDMTARNVQEEAKKKGLPWTIAKGFDTFLPVSQEIAKSRLPDPHNAFLRLSVGSQMRQADSTGLMLYRIPRLLAEISRVMTLEKGDLVLTGTPKGVGQVKSGDVMKASIEYDGKELEEGRIEVEVKDREGRYRYSET